MSEQLREDDRPSADEVDAANNTALKDARRKSLDLWSFEFSTKGTDTLPEPQTIAIPYQTCYHGETNFLLRTFQRDGIEFEGPFRMPDEAIEELREMLDEVGVRDRFEADVAEQLEITGDYWVYGIRTKVPKATMTELLRLAISKRSVAFEAAKLQQKKLDAEENKANDLEAACYDD